MERNPAASGWRGRKGIVRASRGKQPDSAVRNSSSGYLFVCSWVCLVTQHFGCMSHHCSPGGPDEMLTDAGPPSLWPADSDEYEPRVCCTC